MLWCGQQGARSGFYPSTWSATPVVHGRVHAVCARPHLPTFQTSSTPLSPRSSTFTPSVLSSGEFASCGSRSARRFSAVCSCGSAGKRLLVELIQSPHAAAQDLTPMPPQLPTHFAVTITDKATALVSIANHVRDLAIGSNKYSTRRDLSDHSDGTLYRRFSPSSDLRSTACGIDHWTLRCCRSALHSCNSS
jgi:hypothetical protein